MQISELKNFVTLAFSELNATAIGSVGDLKNWIRRWDKFDCEVAEAAVWIRINSKNHTNDEVFLAAERKFDLEIAPILEQVFFDLEKKFLDCEFSQKLGPEFDIFIRNTKNRLSLFSEKNISALSAARQLDSRYRKIMGGVSVIFNNKKNAVPEMGAFIEDPNRSTRESAFRAKALEVFNVSDQLDDLFDEMLVLRKKIAKNANFKNFRDYSFKYRGRFDYTFEDCLEFHSTVKSVIVPKVSQIMKQRVSDLKIDSLRPWDLSVDPKSSAVIRPFANSSELLKKAEAVYQKMDPEISENHDEFLKSGNFDLDSRQNKAPGGFCTKLRKTKLPYVFMNSIGVRADVKTYFHEFGHALNYLLCRHIEHSPYHFVYTEFSEVGSMAMELLVRPYFSEFYKEDDLQRVLVEQIEAAVKFFPFMSMLDSFQQWVYTTSDDTGRTSRKAKWRELEETFRPFINWKGLEDFRDIGWQYLHVFEHPFYYVEYGIAQLGALAIWKNATIDRVSALSDYKDSLRLGGSVTLPKLFETAGTKFGMSEEIVAPIIDFAIKNSHLA